MFPSFEPASISKTESEPEGASTGPGRPPDHLTRSTGPCDIADLDGDGDIDIVVGEHHLDAASQATLRTLVLENADGIGSNWVSHIVYVGDEHHDGTQIVDIDNDGDKDIVSVGWSNSLVLLYVNGAV